MRRLVYHILVLAALLGLLVSCGQSLSGTSNISGIVTAPAGADITGTTVFACYDGSVSCDRLADTTLTSTGSSSPYRLDSLPQGSYAVIAIKTSNENGEPGPGDLYGYFGLSEGAPILVTPPQTNVNIEMLVFTENDSLQSLPETLRQAITEAQ